MRDEDFSEGLVSIYRAVRWAEDGDSGHLGAAYGVFFQNSVFESRMENWTADCVCDGEWEESNTCPAHLPNFHHFESGLKIRWYKYVGRSQESNIAVTDLQWYRIVVQCIESVVPA